MEERFPIEIIQCSLSLPLLPSSEPGALGGHESSFPAIWDGTIISLTENAALPSEGFLQAPGSEERASLRVSGTAICLDRMDDSNDDVSGGGILR